MVNRRGFITRLAALAAAPFIPAMQAQAGNAAQATVYTYECDLILDAYRRAYPGITRVWFNRKLLWQSELRSL